MPDQPNACPGDKLKDFADFLKAGAWQADTEPQDDLLYMAWTIIANAYEGDWDAATPEWKDAAERWRDAFHEHLGRGTRSFDPLDINAIRRRRFPLDTAALVNNLCDVIERYREMR